MKATLLCKLVSLPCPCCVVAQLSFGIAGRSTRPVVWASPVRTSAAFPASQRAAYLWSRRVFGGELVKTAVCREVAGSLHVEYSSFAEWQPLHRQRQLHLPLCCPSSYASSPRWLSFQDKPKGTVSYSLSLLFSDLGPSGLLYLFPSSTHISSPSYSCPWYLLWRGLFFFFFPFIFLFPSLICLSCCRQGCSLSADSAIPSLTLPTPFYSLYPSSLVLCPSHLPAQPWGHYAQGFFASVSGFLLCGCFLPSPGAFTHPSSLCSSIFCLFPVTSSSPSFVARPRYPQCEALRELRMFTGRLWRWISPASRDFLLPSLKRTTWSCPLTYKSMVMAASSMEKMVPHVIGSNLSLCFCPASKVQSFCMKKQPLISQIMRIHIQISPPLL